MSGIDLHILANFKADPALEWDLEAGDILYLPPNFAHNGRALDDDCMTYSVGFRAPSLQEILSGLHDQLLEQQDEKQRFCAPVDLSHPHHHAQIQAADLQYLQQQMTQMLQQPTRLLDWFGKRMSEVKYPDLQLILDEKQTEQALASARNGQAFFRPGDARICYGVAPDYPARLQVFCNGASIDISQELESLIQAICNEVDFDFGGLDFKAHPDITPLMRFLLQQQGLVELTQN